MMIGKGGAWCGESIWSSSSWMDGQEKQKRILWSDYPIAWMPQAYTVEEIWFYKLYRLSAVIGTLGGKALPVLDIYPRRRR